MLMLYDDCTLEMVYQFPGNYHDFGPTCMNDYDIALYDQMVAERLPDGIEWMDDMLWAEEGSPESELNFPDLMYDIEGEAWEEFCECTATDAAWLAAASKYGVDVPEGYKPGWDDGTHDDRCYDDDDDDDDDDACI